MEIHLKIEISKPTFAPINHEDVEKLDLKSNFSVINFEEVDRVAINLTFKSKSKKDIENVRIRKELDLHFDTYKTYLHLESYESFDGFIEVRLRPGKVFINNTFIDLN